MSKIILILGAIGIVVLGAILIFSQPQEQSSQGETIEEATEAASSPESANVIVYLESGYSPPELTIEQGDTVIFRNESSREVWPASDIHPTHTVYPGSGIQKCFDNSDTATVFDACRSLEEGEEYSFVFNEPGTWRFHNHLRPSVTGTIIVQEQQE